uniref:Integrase catalytic domain-containing protein n=1 Tax=Amphimedon queenslandica TaxID=400682 RepID=A0A1X7U111_AMPQE
MFMHMGLPHIITSDQGGEFVNLNKKLMGKLGIKHHLTTAYHPQANGLAERYNQTLQNMLIKYVNHKQDQWDEYLDMSVFAYNTSLHHSTHYSPFELMFGCKATLPIDLDMKKDTNNEETENQDNQDLQETEEELTPMDADRLTEKRKELIEEGKLNIKEAQKKQKEVYDQKHARPEGFQIGMKVLKEDFCQKKRANGKLDVKYL